MKMIFIFAVVFLAGLVCIGCIKSRSQSKWIRYKSLDELWPRLKNEKIESINFCDEDPQADIDLWYSYGAIPKDNLEEAKKLLGDELDNRFDISPQKNPASTCQGMMKIVTNNGRYITPVQEHIPQNNWQEHASLAAIWPRLQKEKIEKISFCDEILGSDIDSWKDWELPKEFLEPCIKMIDAAMEIADPNNFKWGPVWRGRMKIVTDKGKYLVPAETEIYSTASPNVFGNEWISYELGQYLKMCRAITPEEQSH